MFWIIAAFVALSFTIGILDDFMEGGTRFASTELSSSVSVSATTIPLADGTNFPAGGGTVFIRDEAICYSSKSGDNLTGLTRGCLQTEAAAHASGTQVFSSFTASLAGGAKYNIVKEAEALTDLSIFGGLKLLVNFLTKSVPQYISFDYSFLQGELFGFQMALIRMGLVVVLGTALITYLVAVIFGRG